MFDMAPMKAPGSDGFHTVFFRVSRIKSVIPFVIGSEVCSSVMILTQA